MTGRDAIQPLAGKKFGVVGDSISALFKEAWQNVVATRTGMTLVEQDARAVRHFSQAFECFGDPKLGGTPGQFDSTHSLIDGTTTCGQQTIGISEGQTLDQVLADVDIEVVELGTNDIGGTVGTLGDSTNTPTLYGNIRWVVETLLTAKPTMRLVLVTPEYRTDMTADQIQATVTAIASYGASMGIPVINMNALGGVNAITAPKLLQGPVHPSTYAFTNIYGPVIAQGILSVF